MPDYGCPNAFVLSFLSLVDLQQLNQASINFKKATYHTFTNAQLSFMSRDIIKLPALILTALIAIGTATTAPAEANSVHIIKGILHHKAHPHRRQQNNRHQYRRRNHRQVNHRRHRRHQPERTHQRRQNTHHQNHRNHHDRQSYYYQ